jgi:hypothetical protein
MSKLFKLKKWLSLEDASTRLSNSFGEEVLINDILQFALNDEIELCWLLNNQLVCEAKYSITLMLSECDSVTFEKTNKIPEEYAHIPNDIPDDFVFNMMPTNVLSAIGGMPPRKETVLINGIRIIGKPFKADGAYRIDLNTGAMKSYVSNWLTGKENEWFSMYGMILRGSDNKLYQPVDLLPLSRETQKETGKYSVYDGSPYPTDSTPQISELVVLREDIEKFELSFTESDIEKPRVPIDLDDRILKSQTLAVLFENIQKAVKNYPSWRKGLNKNAIQMSDIDEWLSTSITSTKRDAEIVKKVIIEIFDVKKSI